MLRGKKGVLGREEERETEFERQGNNQVREARRECEVERQEGKTEIV